MPRFDVRVQHSTVVSASPDRTYATLRAIDLNRSRWIRWLFAIRSLPSRARRASPSSSARRVTFLESAQDMGWVILEERERELVAGSVTQPWKAEVHFRGLPGPAFIAFNEPNFAKIAWSIAVEPAESASRVTLET